MLSDAVYELDMTVCCTRIVPGGAGAGGGGDTNGGGDQSGGAEAALLVVSARTMPTNAAAAMSAETANLMRTLQHFGAFSRTTVPPMSTLCVGATIV